MLNNNLEIKNINDELEKNTSIHEKIAIWTSNKIGSMAFVYALVVFIILWSSINIGLLVTGHQPFDKPYEFAVLLLISNTIQLLTPLFILVSQNIQSKRDKALADQEYLLAKKTEEETKLMFEYLKEINEQFKVLLNKFNTQQLQIISLEEQQKDFNDTTASYLVDIIHNVIQQINTRPCLLEESKDNSDIQQKLLDALGGSLKPEDE